MEFKHETGRVYAQDAAGTLIAEITFPAENGVATIDHTFVDGSLRGQGVAGQLVRAAVADIRAAGLKARPTCSYAVKWFDQHPEEVDGL